MAEKEGTKSTSKSGKKKVMSSEYDEATTTKATTSSMTATSLGQSVSEGDAAVIDSLKALYKEKLLGIENRYMFNKFNHAEILDSELAAKPTVLLIGQYSTGKTSFIRNLIGMDYPEIHIGPEPTTDRFIAVVYGEESKTIKGNALTGVNELPFSGLSVFGSSFLNKFSAAVVPAPFLKDVNIIDTPGVLSGEKQRTSRGYDFAKVSRWFAERSDLILLLFDCSKLDISDEFKSVIEELQPHEDKVHCVLNKADQLDQESLMRVYGALLWSMGRIFKGAEVTRIYVGSFHNEPLLREEHTALFNKDKRVLMSHISQLPKACSMRKINEMVKRIRLAIVHVCIVGYLKSQMPWIWGSDKKQLELIKRLDEIFLELRRTYSLAEGDFPKTEEYRQALMLCNFATFPGIDRRVLNDLQDMLLKDIPKITAMVAGMEGRKKGNEEASGKQPVMFSFNEKNHYKVGLPVILAVVSALLVLVLAVAMASNPAVLTFMVNNLTRPASVPFEPPLADSL